MTCSREKHDQKGLFLLKMHPKSVRLSGNAFQRLITEWKTVGYQILMIGTMINPDRSFPVLLK
jgi:hypothetical protein